MMKREVNHRWTASYAAQATSWVIGGASTQKRFVRHEFGRIAKIVSAAKRMVRKNTDDIIARSGERKGTTCQLR